MGSMSERLSWDWLAGEFGVSFIYSEAGLSLSEIGSEHVEVWNRPLGSACSWLICNWV